MPFLPLLCSEKINVVICVYKEIYIFCFFLLCFCFVKHTFYDIYYMLYIYYYYYFCVIRFYKSLQLTWTLVITHDLHTVW